MKGPVLVLCAGIVLGCTTFAAGQANWNLSSRIVWVPTYGYTGQLECDYNGGTFDGQLTLTGPTGLVSNPYGYQSAMASISSPSLTTVLAAMNGGWAITSTNPSTGYVYSSYSVSLNLGSVDSSSFVPAPSIITPARKN